VCLHSFKAFPTKANVERRQGFWSKTPS
jgi:hypothetical protein